MSIFFSANIYSYSTDNNNGIYKDYFSNYVRQEGYKILANHSINISFLSHALQQNYEDCIASALRRLDVICRNNGCFFIDLYRIQDITAEEIQVFVDFFATLVFTHQLASEINDAICNLLHKNDLVKDDVFKDSSIEYNSRYGKVKDKLQKIMMNEYRDYVTKQEVEKAVSCEFTVLVARIKNTKKEEVEKPKEKETGFWDWFIGPSSNLTYVDKDSSALIANTSRDYASDDKVYKNEIEQKIPVIADSVLQENGYSQDYLPARVISDYSDVIQKIIKNVKDKISCNCYEYLYVNEIKSIAKTDLQPIFDKIKFKGEKCTICLEDFTTWQQLGVLKCGHIFHKDCIDTSLTQFGKKCPLCGIYSEKVDHKETVPWQ